MQWQPSWNTSRRDSHRRAPRLHLPAYTVNVPDPEPESTYCLCPGGIEHGDHYLQLVIMTASYYKNVSGSGLSASLRDCLGIFNFCTLLPEAISRWWCPKMIIILDVSWEPRRRGRKRTGSWSLLTKHVPLLWPDWLEFEKTKNNTIQSVTVQQFCTWNQQSLVQKYFTLLLFKFRKRIHVALSSSKTRVNAESRAKEYGVHFGVRLHFRSNMYVINADIKEKSWVPKSGQ